MEIYKIEQKNLVLSLVDSAITKLSFVLISVSEETTTKNAIIISRLIHA